MNRKIKECIMTAFGSFLVSMAIGLFFLPTKIVSGGVSGLSTIMFYAFGFKPSVTMLVLNVMLLVVGLKYLGKTFVIKTIIASVMLSLSTEIFCAIPAPTQNIFLATVFGSVFYGLGLAICFCNNASTGGTDIVSRLIQVIVPHIEVGRALFIVDGVIIGISLFVFKSVDVALFGIIALFIISTVTDIFILNMNVSKLVFVITDKGDTLSNLLITTSPRGITMLNGVGCYTKTDKNVLMCALKSNEIKSFREKVTSIDKNAFVIFAEAQQIFGNGFRIYR